MSDEAKVHKREDFAEAADALGLNAERALAGMVSRIFGATLEQVADDIAECADVALRELAQEHLPRLNRRMLELMEQKTRARTGG